MKKGLRQYRENTLNQFPTTSLLELFLDEKRIATGITLHTKTPRYNTTLELFLDEKRIATPAKRHLNFLISHISVRIVP